MKCAACQRKGRGIRASAPLVPPDFWLLPAMRVALTSRHIGRVIYAYRTHPYHGRALSQEVVGGWLGLSQAQLSRVENGPPVRDLAKLMSWSRVLGIPGQLLWFEQGEPDEPGPEVPAVAGTGEVSATLRRDLLALGGSVAAGTAAGQLFGVLDGELSLVHITLGRGSASPEWVAGLEQAAAELGVQVARGAPLAVLEPTLTHLRGVRSLLVERQPTRLQARLVRISAKLSTVVGEIMMNVGRFAHAREWYKAAEYAAGDAGDRYLTDITLAGQAYLPTYSDDPRGVIALLAPRLDGRDPTPSPAISFLWGLTARAHAALGEAAEFNQAIENARECLERSPTEFLTPGIFSFTPEKLAFYEADGAVLCNEPHRATTAADRALSLYDVTAIAEPALVRLEKARALVQSGEVLEAYRVAIEAVSDHDAFRSATVRTRAQRFDRSVRASRGHVASEWRDTYHRLFVRRAPNQADQVE